VATAYKDKLKKNNVNIGDGKPLQDKKLSFNIDKDHPDENPYIKYEGSTERLLFSGTGNSQDEIQVAPTIKIAQIFNCAAGVQAGDLIRMSLTTDNAVVKVVDNLSINRVMGVVDFKANPTDTKCRVVMHGFCDFIYQLNFTRGKPLFVSNTGTPTNFPILSGPGYLHKIGHAVSVNKIFVDVSSNRVKLLTM